MRTALSIVLVVALAAGCGKRGPGPEPVTSNEWQPVSMSEKGWAAMFPPGTVESRPQVTGREITTVEASGAVFSVTFIPMKSNEVFNEGKATLALSQAYVGPVKTSDRIVYQGASGLDCQVDGDKDLLCLARFLVQGPRVYLLAVAGPRNTFPHGDAKRFFESMQFVAPVRPGSIPPGQATERKSEPVDQAKDQETAERVAMEFLTEFLSGDAGKALRLCARDLFDPKSADYPGKQANFTVRRDPSQPVRVTPTGTVFSTTGPTTVRASATGFTDGPRGIEVTMRFWAGKWEVAGFERTNKDRASAVAEAERVIVAILSGTTPRDVQDGPSAWLASEKKDPNAATDEMNLWFALRRDREPGAEPKARFQDLEHSPGRTTEGTAVVSGFRGAEKGYRVRLAYLNHRWMVYSVKPVTDQAAALAVARQFALDVLNGRANEAARALLFGFRSEPPLSRLKRSAEAGKSPDVETEIRPGTPADGDRYTVVARPRGFDKAPATLEIGMTFHQARWSVESLSVDGKPVGRVKR